MKLINMMKELQLAIERLEDTIPFYNAISVEGRPAMDYQWIGEPDSKVS